MSRIFLLNLSGIFFSVSFVSFFVLLHFFLHECLYPFGFIFLRAPTEWNAFQAEKMFIHLIDASAYMAIVLTFDCVPVEKLLMCVKVLS